MKHLFTFLILFTFCFLGAQNFTKLKTFDKIDLGTSGYQVVAAFDSKIVFKLGNTNDPHLLYISDGTVSGTKEIDALTSSDYFDRFVNDDPTYLYFVKEISGSNDELIRMNKATSVLETLGNDFAYKYLRLWNNKLYYMSGSDLMQIDPVTKTVKTVKSSLTQGDPLIFTVFNNKLTIIHRNTTNKVVMTTSDGTLAGTIEVKDFGIDVAANFKAEGPWIHDDKLFFVIRARYNGVFDKSMWASDGTDAGTKKIKAIDLQNSGAFYDITGIDGGSYFYFRASDPSSTVMQLFRTDGTEAGTIKLGADKLKAAESFVNYKGKTYFAATDLSNVGNIFSVENDEVTSLYNNNATGVTLGGPFVFNDSLFFIGNNSALGSEFWKSDGSANGLSAVVQGNLASGASIFTATASGKYIYYTKRINGEEKELWIYDPKKYVAAVKPAIQVLTVFPNPTNNYIQLPENMVEGECEIFDIAGRKIIKMRFLSNKIDVSTLLNGIYNIKINTNNKSYISKFIKL